MMLDIADTWASADLTTPPFSTNCLPTSNCGLIKHNNSDSFSFNSPIAAGKIYPATLKKLAAAAGGPGPGLSFSKPTVPEGEPLRLEIESFLNAVRTRQEPRVTARQGRDALALALEIEAAMETHAERAGLKDFFRAGL